MRGFFFLAARGNLYEWLDGYSVNWVLDYGGHDDIYIYMGLWFLVDGYRLMYGGFENNLLCVLILVLAGCGFLR